MSNRVQSIMPSLNLRGRAAVAQAAAVGGFLVLAVLLGGSSAGGITANAIIQVAAVIAIAATLGWARAPQRTPAERHLLILACLFAALYVVQLVPLPPTIWTALPGRKLVTAGLTALGDPLPWMPLSLAPAKTLQSGLALLALIAVILMIGAFPRPVARAAILALLAVMIVSVLVGVAQVAGSERLYFYSFTNTGSAVGFFANANHLATLMCLAIPLAAGLIARWRNSLSGEKAALRGFAVALLLGIVMLALLGVTMTKSIAGVLLSVLAIVGSGVLMSSGMPRSLRLGLVGGVAVIIVIAVAVALTNGADDFGIAALDISEGGRHELWQGTYLAIKQFGACGTGFGTFVHVFHLFENPETVNTIFVNHAHNDMLEFTLEGGLPAICLLVAFLVWFGVRCVVIWSTKRRRDPVAQGASIAALVILLHSLVDYPLRTAAIATIFGLCLAIMARPPSRETQDNAEADSDPAPRHLSA